jgi:hypothetical protein
MPLQTMKLSPFEQFQFVQTRIGELTLRICPKSALTTSQIDELTKRLNSVRPFIKVDVEPVDRIEPAASGKHVLFKPITESTPSFQ